MEFIQGVPDIFIQFIVVLLLSLVIGLEQRGYHNTKDEPVLFGSDRTFTLIGLLGFILYLLDKSFFIFAIGAFILGLFLAIFYEKKISNTGSYGMTNMIVAVLVYCLGPIVATQPKGLTIMVVVAVLILVQLKSFFRELVTKIDNEEFLTLGKFLIIAGVVLPIVPRSPNIPYLNISAYDIWVTVVVVSSISYASYILQKFVFRKSGVIISGLLGGLYSSTASTVILAKKSKEVDSHSNAYPASIVLATSMMYVRITILMFIFNRALGTLMFPYMAVLALVSFAAGSVIYYMKKPSVLIKQDIFQDKNPLEIKVAIIFGLLFALFSFLTQYTIQNYGSAGLNVLSFLTGFTDIDPFLLNLFTGEHNIQIPLIAKAVLQAIIANNILKSIYTAVLADRKSKKLAILGIAVITAVNIIFVFLI
jgi:uncharacterized membrane protein (DUF4010 family)